MTVSYSDHLQPIDVIIWAYIYCHRVDYALYAGLAATREVELDGNNILWPVIKVPQLSQDLHVKKDTVQDSLNRLRAVGFLVTERKSAGSRMILSERSTLDDTLHGENVRGWTFVTLDLLKSGLLAQEILVLVFLDRKKEAREYARSSQERIARFLGKDIRTVRRIIAKLKELGRLESSPIPEEDTKIYQYKIFLRDLVLEEDTDEEAPAEPVEDLQDTENPAGMDLAKMFEKTIKEYQKDPDWAMALERPNAINLPALARTFNQWLGNGADSTDIVRMIEHYPLISNFRVNPKNLPPKVRERLSRTPIWQDFLAKRPLLADQVKTLKEHEIAFNPDAEGFAEYWGVDPDDVKPYETHKTWGELQAEKVTADRVPSTVDLADLTNAENRLAMYGIRMAS
ncbi:helix-turn-helix domain-containing protein [Streptosporangium canum]|uniref:helix-turn-helix domain-containing protein n=1 Tax=Streptosporangium canum TaxID=324952 RepID=UPI00342C061B